MDLGGSVVCACEPMSLCGTVCFGARGHLSPLGAGTFSSSGLRTRPSKVNNYTATDPWFLKPWLNPCEKAEEPRSSDVNNSVDASGG